MGKKTIALIGGSDWVDASCEHLEMDESIDLKQAFKDYHEKYDNYHNTRTVSQPYIFFRDYLYELGATDADVECVSEDELDG